MDLLPGNKVLMSFYRGRYDQKVADKYRELFAYFNVDFDKMCEFLVHQVYRNNAPFNCNDSMEMTFLKHIATEATKYLNWFYKGWVAQHPMYFVFQVSENSKKFTQVSYFDLFRMQALIAEAVSQMHPTNNVRRLVLYVSNNLEVRG